MSMQLSDAETGRLVEQLSSLTGETTDEAVRNAIKERLDRLAATDQEIYKTRVMASSSSIAALPELDPREADGILGYNEHGHFD